MIYELGFLDSALKEWRKFDRNTRGQFRKKVEERLANSHVPSARLLGSSNRYKIKLRSLGYSLVYEVRNAQMLVIVVAAGKREKNAVYKAAQAR